MSYKKRKDEPHVRLIPFWPAHAKLNDILIRLDDISSLNPLGPHMFTAVCRNLSTGVKEMESIFVQNSPEEVMEDTK